MPENPLIPTADIERRIYLIRGQRVMLDRDLAELYGVTTAALNQAVKRNSDRFPDDFMFQLDNEEFENWISQIIISNPGLRMGVRKRPLAFTFCRCLSMVDDGSDTVQPQYRLPLHAAHSRMPGVPYSPREIRRKVNGLEGLLGPLQGRH